VLQRIRDEPKLYLQPDVTHAGSCFLRTAMLQLLSVTAAVLWGASFGDQCPIARTVPGASPGRLCAVVSAHPSAHTTASAPADRSGCAAMAASGCVSSAYAPACGSSVTGSCAACIQFLLLLLCDQHERCTAQSQGASKEQGARVLEAINSSGKAFMIHTELGGRFTMRLAIGGAQTQVDKPVFESLHPLRPSIMAAKLPSVRQTDHRLRSYRGQGTELTVHHAKCRMSLALVAQVAGCAVRAEVGQPFLPICSVI
jgi:hypothetical protein